MKVKILGSGCPRCRSMYNTVMQIVDRDRMEVEVEYVQDIEQILSYGVLATPALVINEKVVMLGSPSRPKIEAALKQAIMT